jgi:hypothetical protein
MPRRIKGVVRFKPIKFLKAAQEEAKREKLVKTAKAIESVRFQIRSEARKGAIPEFKKPLIDAPGEFAVLPKRVKKQLKTIII